jgi:large subunit ribosomal protein L6
MSKIGKIPVVIKEGTEVLIEGKNVKVKGPKGELNFEVPRGIAVSLSEGKVLVAQDKKNDKDTTSLYGLTRAQIANMIKGVSEGFERKLELSGVGFRAEASGSNLTIYVGFSHPVKINQEGVNFSVAENVITIAGVDKSLVGNTAARIRDIKPPEPYKGKGIKYQGERIRRKVGKAAKAIGVGAKA